MKIINIIIQKPIVFLILFFITLEAKSIGNEKSSVRNIFVEFSINNSLPSRKRALDISYKVAIKRYMEWVTVLKDKEILNLLDEIDSNSLVSGYSIENEKFTKIKYSALITVNLDLLKIKKFLKINSIGFFLEEGPKTLIIPVIKYKDRTILWDDPNPWFEAWMKRPLDSNLTNFILPNGQVEDLLTLSAKDAEDLINYKIKNMSTRYEAQEVLILQLFIEEQNKEFYRLKLKAYKGIKEEKFDLLEFSIAKEESLEKTILNLANDFAKKYDDLWVKENIKRQELESYATIQLTFANFYQWIKLKDLLLNSRNISSFKIVRISNSSATVFVKILAKEKLVYDLEEENIDIDINGDTWKIRTNS